MSSYSGSEFALRVALCDLIERLKRSEHKCLYLEQCRNEFAKEIMRLRVHNEYLTNLNRHSITSQTNPNYNHNHSNSNSNSHNNSGGISRLLTQFNVKTRRDNAINNNNNNSDIVVDGDNDESWEEITVRLIKELRRDVAITASSYGNYPNNVAINDTSFGVSNSGAVAVAAAPCGGSDAEDRNAHNNYGTHYSSSIDANISGNDINAKTVSRVMNQNKSAVSSNEVEFNGVVNDCSNYKLNNYNISKTVDQPKERVIVGHNKHENFEIKTGVSTKRTQSSESMDQTECINAFCYAIYYVKKDLNEVLHALTQQNEKLNRLKAKQLRSYFQRQLNFDHSVHNNMIASNSKLDQKSNQDNY